jgi:hypothetical protein
VAAARKRSVPYARQVFLNCPFDDDYHPLLRAAVFTIHACGFTARIALENTGSENVRLDRLVQMIGECGLGIHDLSRVRLTSPTDLPRFNMPFECGVFYGARRFGAHAQRRKRFLLLDKEPFQYQKTMSDAAGLDPRAHGDDPETLIACIRDFLAAGLDPKPIGRFRERLPLAPPPQNGFPDRAARDCSKRPRPRTLAVPTVAASIHLQGEHPPGADLIHDHSRIS